jgi:acyl carrier protein phosphodiesterase
MNYLAHAYLSFQQEEILVGNMISDYVKGKKKFDYPAGIQKGIRLHRAIDTFTDYHEATKTARQFFKPAVGLYAGAFMDVVYDHFLATDKNEFRNEEVLRSFAAHTYEQLEKHVTVFPDRFQLMFPYMKKYDWLYHYQFKKGIESSMGGLVRRTAYLTDAGPVYALFEKNYEVLKTCYQAFFPELKKFVMEQPELLQPLP